MLATLHPWVLWHEERGLACPLPADLARRCHAALESAEGARAPHGGVRQIVLALEAMGLDPKSGVRTPCGHALDLQVVWRGQPVGILVDGPDAYLTPPGPKTLFPEDGLQPSCRTNLPPPPPPPRAPPPPRRTYTRT